MSVVLETGTAILGSSSPRVSVRLCLQYLLMIAEKKRKKTSPHFIFYGYIMVKQQGHKWRADGERAAVTAGRNCI